jgi:2-dehydro-3-deoxyglucarate aldolase/4-hydroxy-2-oxoheptanedioate aldolase
VITATIRDMVEHRRAKFGTFLVEFATPGIGHILKATGIDFVLFDMEHSGITLDQVKSALRYLEAADLPAIVGLPSKDLYQISQVLDIGAPAIMTPMVETVEEVRSFLDKVRYPPLGKRAVAVGVSHDRFRRAPPAETMARANREISYFAKIETRLGAENVDAIAAMPGVDGLWIGHVDLTSSLGRPGDFDDPAFRQAVAKIGAAAKTHGKSLGRLCSTVEEGVALFRSGFDFIGYSGDVWLLQDALSHGVSGLRSACV